MHPLFAFILDIAIIWFFFGNNIRSLLSTKMGKIRIELREYAKILKSALIRDKDILTTADKDFLTGLQARIAEARTPEAQRECLAHLQSDDIYERLHRIRRDGKIRSNLEVAVVAVGIAFGIRALFIQPFKIPTGSMQPTLFGIHYEETQESLPTSRLTKFFNFINYSETQVELKTTRSGSLDPQSIRPLPSYPLSPKTSLRIGDITYTVSGSADTIRRTLFLKCMQEKRSLFFQEGEQALHGTLQTGDHLFVNRLSLCFREPRRGDIMVFLTDNLKDPDGTGFGGRFYVKRLVGLPGDTLRIQDGMLYLKRPGASEFEPVDEKIHPSFAKINSRKNGYNGYANMQSSEFLADGQAEFTVPEKEYFMLGDNTLNSKDSRYWGTVPRKNLLGSPCLVWYPFSRRFGTVDRN